MTASERDTFDEMFQAVYESVENSYARGKGTPLPGDQADFVPRGFAERTGSAFRQSLSASMRMSTGLDEEEREDRTDVVARLEDLHERVKRRGKRRIRAPTEGEDLLDRLREEAELCTTDRELLEWAMVNVFGEPAENIPSSSSVSGVAGVGSAQQEGEQKQENSSQSTSPSQPSQSLFSPYPVAKLPPHVYAQLLAHLIRTFRDRFSDPHLSLSVFEFAKHRSPFSYVIGCTTPAYNEMLHTRWACFRDLRGICDALEEMHVNGVMRDGKTRKVVEMVRRDVGDKKPWLDEGDVEADEVLKMLTRLEEVSMMQQPGKNRDDQRGEDRRAGRVRTRRWTSASEGWKLKKDGGDDKWKFGDWDMATKRRGSFRSSMSLTSRSRPALRF